MGRKSKSSEVIADTNIVELLDVILNNFKANKMELTYMDINKNIPEFYIRIKDSRNRSKDDIDDLLKSTYAILWSLCYGKVTNTSRRNTIKLNYDLA